MMLHFFRQPIIVSSSLHLLTLGVLLTLWLYLPKHSEPTRIDFTVIKQLTPKALSQIETLKFKPPPLAKKLEAQPRAVFGLTKSTITTNTNTRDNSTDAVTLKEGNTIAKSQDRETLNPEDQGALPNPTDEFLVSSMPVLVSDVRIPYPKSAREANIEGPVILELLIDADGTVRSVVVISGPGFGLNEAALQALKEFKFKPAKVDNQSVAVKIRYTYRFVLETK